MATTSTEFEKATDFAFKEEDIERAKALVGSYAPSGAREHLTTATHDAMRNFAPGVEGPSGQVTGGSGLEPEALLLLGQTYLKMHKWPEAREACLMQSVLGRGGATHSVLRTFPFR